MPRNNDKITAIVIALGLFAPFMWMLMDRMEPYEITNGRIDPPNPTKNGSFTVTWDIRVMRSCQVKYSSVTRVITDNKGFRHVAAPTAATFGTADQSRSDEIRRPVPLPENVTGPAKYFADVCYACNPIQVWLPICFKTPTLEFDIEDR